MAINSTKIFGWGLIFVGLLIIIWPLYHSYKIFSGEADIPQIFKTEEKFIQEPIVSEELIKETPTNPAEIQAELRREIQDELQKAITGQIKEIIPTDTLPEFLNLIAWSIIAWIFILGGFKISSIGANMAKDK